MITLTVKITESFGISSFSKKFKFDKDKPKVQLIYGQNGQGKSSLSRTLSRWKEGTPEIQDEIYGNKGSCMVTIDGKPLMPDNLISVLSMDYDANFGYSAESTRLLVNETHMKSYTETFKVIRLASNRLQTAVMNTAKYKVNSDIEDLIATEYTKLFNKDVTDFIPLLKKNLKDIKESDLLLASIRYESISNDKVIRFIDNEENQKIIKPYINKYEELVSGTPYLSDKFNTTVALYIADTLHKASYFDKHALSLRQNEDSDFEPPLKSKREFLDKLTEEYKKVINDPDLLELFHALDKKISNPELRTFRSELTRNENRLAIAHMTSASDFLKAALNDYLKSNIELVEKLIDVYEKNIPKLNEILDQAAKETTKWEHVRDKFNERFKDQPLKIDIVDKQNSIASDRPAPYVKFTFESNKGSKEIANSSEATQNLSSGEKRIIRLLYLLFKIEEMRTVAGSKVLVLDDLVDSFDYKNKYRILEYITELAIDGDFLVIILTHNYDFFRLAHSRIFGDDGERDQSYIMFRNPDGVVDLSDKMSLKPLKFSIGQSGSQKAHWLFLIPLARNICEYQRECEVTTCTDSSHSKCVDYMSFTSALHTLTNTPDTNSIHLSLVNSLSRASNPFSSAVNIHTAFVDEARLIAKNPTINEVNIHEKLVLSVASRLNAEMHMKKTMSEADINACLNEGNLTRSLYKKCKISNSEKRIIEKVLMTSPEHIHINSFMYEPLVDLDINELVDIFNSSDSL